MRKCTWCGTLIPDNRTSRVYMEMPAGCCAPDGDGHLWIDIDPRARYTLSRKGFPDMIVREKDGQYEYLSYVHPHYGTETWKRLPQNRDWIEFQIMKEGKIK